MHWKIKMTNNSCSLIDHLISPNTHAFYPRWLIFQVSLCITFRFWTECSKIYRFSFEHYNDTLRSGSSKMKPFNIRNKLDHYITLNRQIFVGLPLKQQQLYLKKRYKIKIICPFKGKSIFVDLRICHDKKFTVEI